MSNTNRKSNVLLFSMLFLIPIIALNASFYFLFKIENSWQEKDFARKGIQEAEMLASEADFKYQFGKHFRAFMDVVSADASLNFVQDSLMVGHLEQSDRNIFKQPFPDYELFVFRKNNDKSTPELIYNHGDIKGRKRSLCYTFEYLFSENANLELDSAKKKSNESFARNFISQNISPESIARELKGLVTYGNSKRKSFWFIWDYVVTPQGQVYGSILICHEREKFEKYGRLLAVQDLIARENKAEAKDKNKTKVIGAFLPLYREYGEEVVPEPLKGSDRYRGSKLFDELKKELIIEDKKELDKWIKNDLPQGKKIGNFTAFTYLPREGTHIAIILMKSLARIQWPKWLKYLNVINFVLMISVLAFGLLYDKWPRINLRFRFILSYVLVSILPLCLLGVTAYGYLFQYERNLVNDTGREFQKIIKSFESRKSGLINDYKAAFSKALKDENLANIIKKEGINSPLAARRVLDIFEDPEQPLPVLAVQLIDEVGEGAFMVGSAPTSHNIKLYVQSFASTNVKILRNTLQEEGMTLRGYNPAEEETLADNAYKSLTGVSLDNALNKHFSVPVPRKNGELNSIYLFDLIKIDGKNRYMLYVLWDDQTLDHRVLQECIDTYAFKNPKYTFAGFRVKDMNVTQLGKVSRHSSLDDVEKAKNYVKLVGSRQGANNIIEKDKLFVVVPVKNFADTVIVGWADRSELNEEIQNRTVIFILFFIASILILLLCSFRSVRVFLMPVTALKGALDRVSSNNLNIELKSHNHDELGQLSSEFSSMIEDLRERERLSKLISDQAVAALKSGGEDVLDKTETFEGVALVSDIRNFTGISEENDPLVITDLLNEHFAEMARIISKNGGLIYKFIGDAIEAVFPENEEFNEAAAKRAFKAGCQMIVTLASINSRRRKKKLFQYKIGVGLCYGLMHSGSIGSLETRLDYAILGEPLKKAAELEAMSKLNPAFPIVVDEYIAERMSLVGFCFKTVEEGTKKAYIFDAIKDVDALNSNGMGDFSSVDQQSEQVEEKEVKYEIFSLQESNLKFDAFKNLFITGAFTLFLSLIIILGFNAVYSTNIEKLKSESRDVLARYIEQIKSEGAFQTAFGKLCQEITLDTHEIINKEDYETPLSQQFEKILKKYETKGRPMPCYYFFRPKGLEVDSKYVAEKGFPREYLSDLQEIALFFNNRWKKGYEGNKPHDAINRFLINTKFYDINYRYYKQPYLGNIGDKEYYIEREDFLNPDDTSKGTLIMGIPIKENLDNLAYLAGLAGKHELLAFSSEKGWTFSDDYPEKEKDFLKANIGNISILEDRGYLIDTLTYNNKELRVFGISKELLAANKPILVYNIIAIFLALSFIISILIYFYKHDFNAMSVSKKLISDTLLVGFLPIITVFFVSYLYINEDYFVKLEDSRNDLQKYMETVENKEGYYHPYCWHYYKKFASSPELKAKVDFVNEAKTQEEQDARVKLLKKYIEDNSVDRSLPVNPEYEFREIDIISKAGWGCSMLAREGREDKLASLSEFAKVLSAVAKYIYFGADTSGQNNSQAEGLKSEIMIDTVVKTFTSLFGNNVGNKLINFSSIPLTFNFTYTFVGSCLDLLPDPINSEFIVMGMAYYNSDHLSYLCKDVNKEKPIDQELKAEIRSDKKYLFYAVNTFIGHRICYDLIPELSYSLSNLSTWVNTSNLPFSTNIDLNGKYYAEARRGNYCSDNVFIGLTSDAPVRKAVYSNIPKFAIVLLISLCLLWFVAQSVCEDMLAPIKLLMSGAKAASKGNYAFRTQYRRNDEMGALCASFDQMMKGLEEKQLMNRMVSKTALNETDDVDSTSKKIATVLLYVSAPDFSKALKNSSIHMLFKQLRSQVATIASIVIQEGGDIDKIMGEKLLISFPVGNKNVDDVIAAACRAASKIKSKEDLSFKVAIGVNYGSVISGYLGVGEKRDFTIIGDAVNTTARIATLAEKLSENSCVVSEDVYQSIKDSMLSTFYGSVELKGKALPLKVYLLS